MADSKPGNKPVHRANVFAAHKFLTTHPTIALLYGALSLAAAGASVMGLLRWQEPFLQWSFAALMVLGAIYTFYCSHLGRRS